jgi:hypothetical protein
VEGVHEQTALVGETMAEGEDISHAHKGLGDQQWAREQDNNDKKGA